MTMAVTRAVLALTLFMLFNEFDAVLGGGGTCSYNFYDETNRRDKKCDSLAKKNECDKNPKWTKSNCAKSCGQLCGGPCSNVLNCSPIDLSIVLDSSVSLGAENFLRSKEFLLRLLSCMNVSPRRTRVSVITYGKGVYPDQAINFNSYSSWSQLNKKISTTEWKHGPYTSTGEGIAYMLDKQMTKARGVVPRVGMVLTDGKSQEWQKTIDEAKRAKKAGLKMYAIGVGHSVSKTELNNIASSTKNVFEASSFKALNGIINNLKQSICKEVLSDDPKAMRRCNSDVELMLIIDTSTSISDPDYRKGMNFLSSFVNSFDISSPQKSRVAALLYSTNVWTGDIIKFGQLASTALVKAIKNLPHRYGNTYTGKALEYMNKNFVPKAKAGRAKIAILMTDGVAHDQKFAEQQAKIARDNGVNLVVLGVGNKVDYDAMRKLAGAKGTVIKADDYGHLKKIKNQLLVESCY